MYFFFKQKTAYEMRISDWSSDVCSSDLHLLARHDLQKHALHRPRILAIGTEHAHRAPPAGAQILLDHLGAPGLWAEPLILQVRPHFPRNLARRGDMACHRQFEYGGAHDAAPSQPAFIRAVSGFRD